MARYIGPVCKICRRESEKLFLKGSRCNSSKCALERRGTPPGQHGKNKRFKVSEYGIQLREKQKVKSLYGVLEKQFRIYFKKAAGEKGITGENLITILERRFDNVVYRLGLAPSRNAARQMVRHRHLLINDRIVDIPSFQLKPGDIVKVRENSTKMEMVHSSLRKVRDVRVLPWLEIDKANLIGTFKDMPNRKDIPITVNEQLIVELYSK